MDFKKLSWEEIVSEYNQEWVELIEYDWPDTETYPRSGVVRVHARTRAQFDDLADIDPPFDSAYIFVGGHSLEEKGAGHSDVVVTRGYSQIIVGPDHF